MDELTALLWEMWPGSELNVLVFTDGDVLGLDPMRFRLLAHDEDPFDALDLDCVQALMNANMYSDYLLLGIRSARLTRPHAVRLSRFVDAQQRLLALGYALGMAMAPDKPEPAVSAEPIYLHPGLSVKDRSKWLIRFRHTPPDLQQKVLAEMYRAHPIAS